MEQYTDTSLTVLFGKKIQQIRKNMHLSQSEFEIL